MTCAHYYNRVHFSSTVKPLFRKYIPTIDFDPNKGGDYKTEVSLYTSQVHQYIRNHAYYHSHNTKATVALKDRCLYAISKPTRVILHFLKT